MPNIKLIKASAGSGKTYRLMELFSKCVQCGEATPDRLLATTFTVKAAAHLQSEIRKKLIASGRPDLAATVFSGLIGTVNSICSRLLSEYAVDAGLPPSMTVLTEENADLIFQAATDAVIANHATALEKLASRLELNPIKQPSHERSQEDWRDDVKMIVQLARSNGINASQFDAMAETSCNSLANIFPGSNNVSLQDIKAKIEPYAQREIASLSTKPDPAQSVIKFHKELGDFYKYPTWAKAIGLVNAGKPSRKNYPALNQLHTDLENLAILKSSVLRDDLRDMIRKVFACAKDAMTAYDDFKRQMGLIDFTDQEVKFLELLQGSKSFQKQLSQRIDRMMVDEFQDTSPIQLAIFLKLNDLCKNGSTWVGDPKQAIYGFRGTDPELMATCIRDLRSTETLRFSRRSKENLVNLSNAIFLQVFNDMPPEEVRLAIPPDGPNSGDEARGGSIEAWNLKVPNESQRLSALAKGISDLLAEGIQAKDIAVLVRQNKTGQKLAKELARWNIATTSESGKLKTAPECALAMAGFRYCLDQEDTIAVALLWALYGDHPEWPQTLFDAHAAARDDSRFFKQEIIRQLPLLQKLSPAADETPQELLERVINAMDLDRWVRTMPFPEQRLANLDALRLHCKEYMDMAGASHSTATPAGFLAKLKDDAPAASGTGDNCINILTYHKAKGLEWPIVILAELNKEPKGRIFGPKVIPAPEFHMETPLAGRSLRYWPYPFGSKEPRCLQEHLANNTEQLSANQSNLEEAKRLFYVGLTRARNRLIFALDNLQTAWLDALAPEKIFQFPKEPGTTTEWQVGGKQFTLQTKCISFPETPAPRPSPPVFKDSLADQDNAPHPPARISPSSLQAVDGKATLLCTLPKLSHSIATPPDYDRLGNVFHNYIALNPQTDQLSVAKRLIDNWQMQDYIQPNTVVEASEHFYAWLQQQYPGAVIATEVPVSCHNDDGTLFQGFIDMLVETPKGYVIIDHKTGGNANPAAFAAKHIAQLRLYQQAVKAATGKDILALVIHLPIMNRCYQIE